MNGQTDGLTGRFYVYADEIRRQMRTDLLFVLIGVPPLVVDLHEHFFESLLELFVGSRRRRPFLLFPVQLLLQIGDFVLQTCDRRSSTILVLWGPKAERERER